MCGICGFYTSEPLHRDDLLRMSRALRHRGPDDEGLFLEGPVGLANRRLSIIDPTTGHQPIGNEDGSIQVVCNGEIYNYRELRAELQSAGHQFSTRSDTEVLAHLYEEVGKSCLERLRGMFAIAIWDRRRKELLLARDRLGQKPLFYLSMPGRFAFASEIKSILQLDGVPREMDLDALHHYLSLRFVPSPRTMFKAIRKLPPGHMLAISDGDIEISQYWHLDFRNKLPLSDGEALEALEGQLQDAIQSHLVSDVSVGAFLSGGMDSSSIVAIMRQLTGTGFKTFSIGVEEQSFNELPHARRVARHCETRHIEETVRADLIANLPLMISHLDEPSDPIAACMFQASRLAAQHVKVVLGGDGGDELFAGFDRYLGVRALDHAAWIPITIRRTLSRIAQWVPESFDHKSPSQKVRWLAMLGAQPNLARRYAEATIHSRFSHQQKAMLLGSRIWSDLQDQDAAEILVDAFNQAPAEDPIDRMLYTDYTTRLPEHSLQLSDRMSMAHSLELRSPLLDHRLVQFSAQLPSRLKIRRGQLKYALRMATKRVLPREILSRPKQGFMFPVAHWFQHELHGFLHSVFDNALSIEEGIVRETAVRALIEEHRNGKTDHHVRLWMLLNLEVWFRLFVAGQSAVDVQETLRAHLAVGTHT